MRQFVEDHLASDDGGVTAKPGLPQPMGEHQHGIRTAAFVVRDERPAHRGGHAEGAEYAHGCLRAVEALTARVPAGWRRQGHVRTRLDQAANTPGGVAGTPPGPPTAPTPRNGGRQGEASPARPSATPAMPIPLAGRHRRRAGIPGRRRHLAQRGAKDGYDAPHHGNVTHMKHGCDPPCHLRLLRCCVAIHDSPRSAYLAAAAAAGFAAARRPRTRPTRRC